MTAEKLISLFDAAQRPHRQGRHAMCTSATSSTVDDGQERAGSSTAVIEALAIRPSVSSWHVCPSASATSISSAGHCRPMASDGGYASGCMARPRPRKSGVGGMALRMDHGLPDRRHGQEPLGLSQPDQVLRRHPAVLRLSSPEAPDQRRRALHLQGPRTLEGTTIWSSVVASTATSRSCGTPSSRLRPNSTMPQCDRRRPNGYLSA